MHARTRWLGPLAALLALAPAAAAAEISSPNSCVAIFEGGEGGDRDDPKAAIEIAAARNGSFSGQVVVRAAAGPKAAASELKLKDGDGVIPASAIQVRYALPTGGVRGKKVKRFDALAAEPRVEGALHPVWVTVNVPADAKPGAYEGTLAVAGRKVPVRVKVSAWTLPETQDFATHVGIIQSPESVALQYKVELWSEKHWDLIGKSFDQLARVGNKVICIPLICQTNFGNTETMVRWIKDGDKKFKHDFSIAEKYLDLYIERVGKPAVVFFYIYESFLGGGHGRSKEQTEQGVLVTLLDPATKKVTTFEGPCHNHALPAYPNYPEDMHAFWKPVLDALRERLKARGLGDEAFILGASPDLRPGKNTMVELKKIAPYARWSSQGHGSPKSMHGMPVGYLTYVWNGKTPPDPAAKRWYGWKNKHQCAIFPRYGGNPWVLYPPMWSGAPLPIFRNVGEACLLGNARGFGRVGADFWPVLEGKRRKRCLIARFPKSSWAQVNMTNATTAFLAPGPDGALPTVRFEMMLEGVQECEARIFIEKALLDEAKKAQLGEELAKRAQEVLDERVRRLRDAYAVEATKAKDAKRWDWWAAESGWPERSAKLFAAAAEVSKKLGAE